MTTFDLSEVRRFAADLDARMNRCDNGEGMECATLDDSLLHYAALCWEFREGVRQWGRAVFSGRVKFDPEVEIVLIGEGTRLYKRADERFAYSRQEEADCFSLDNTTRLGAALKTLSQLLNPWITPKLAVGPSARQELSLTPSVAEEVRRRIEALPPLPVEWQPVDPKQQTQFKKLSRKRTV